MNEGRTLVRAEKRYLHHVHDLSIKNGQIIYIGVKNWQIPESPYFPAY